MQPTSSRLGVAAIAASLAVVAAPAVNAAQIGPRQGGTSKNSYYENCPAVYSEAEKRSIAKIHTDWRQLTYNERMAFAELVDAALPGSGKILSEFANEQFFKEKETNEAKLEELKQPYKQKLMALGMNDWLAGDLLFRQAYIIQNDQGFDYKTAFDQQLSLLQGDNWVHLNSYTKEKSEAEIQAEREKSIRHLQQSKAGWEERLMDPNKSYIRLDRGTFSPEQNAVYREGLRKKNPRMNEIEKNYYTLRAAEDQRTIVCFSGGNATVDFPIVKVADLNIPAGDGTVGPGSSADGQATAEGELSPGAIAGIVIGVIAVLALAVGAVAYLGPQFGLNLPLPELPALPM